MHQSGMTILINNGNQQSAANAKLLLQEIIGMDVPLEHLAYWLKGEPAINADYQVSTNHLLGAFTYHVDGLSMDSKADYLTYHSNNRDVETLR